MLPRQYIIPAIFVGAIVVLLLGLALFRSASSTTNTTATKTSYFSSLFPFGSGDVTPNEPGNTGAGNNIPDGGVLPALRKVTDSKVLAAEFGYNKNGLVVRYVERGAGHIYEARVDVPGSERLTNTTIPGAEEVLFVGASSTLYRFSTDNESVENYLGYLPLGTSTQLLTGDTLPPYSRVSVSPSGKTAVGLLFAGTNAVLDTINPKKISERKSLLSLPTNAWLPYATDNGVFLADLPSSAAAGSLQKVVNGSLVPVITNIPGLQASLNPTGQYAIISSAEGASVSTFIFGVDDRSVHSLPFSTIADKCAWSMYEPTSFICAVPTSLPRATYPDDWLLGSVSFADTLWFGDAVTQKVEERSHISDDQAIDAVNISIDQTKNYLIFKNKSDESLWILDLFR